jgi:antitoxin (DNA-binding transcriptional repressor) of toxin-antitoxin stability system
VAGGESIEVTDRGRAVAVLVPVQGDHWQALVSRGQVLPANERETVLDETPVDYGIDASKRLGEIREGDR